MSLNAKEGEGKMQLPLHWYKPANLDGHARVGSGGFSLLHHSPAMHHSVLLLINVVVLFFLSWDTKRQSVEFPQCAAVRACGRCACYTRKQKKDKIGPLPW